MSNLKSREFRLASMLFQRITLAQLHHSMCNVFASLLILIYLSLESLMRLSTSPGRSLLYLYSSLLPGIVDCAWMGRQEPINGHFTRMMTGGRPRFLSDLSVFSYLLRGPETPAMSALVGMYSVAQLARVLLQNGLLPAKPDLRSPHPPVIPRGLRRAAQFARFAFHQLMIRQCSRPAGKA
jgi:hypothetical protein